MKKTIYDFDGTLTPYSLPKFKIIEKCGLKGGLSNPKFIELTKKTQIENNLDFYSAVYDVYFKLIKQNGFDLIDENFSLGYDETIYNEGVEYFLNMLYKNNVENYLLSSGIKVFLDKLDIRKYFKEVYATTFCYNKNKEAIDIEFLMSDKNKALAITNITKQNNNDCSNIIYIGDGLTDYYAMKYIKDHGGINIFVYLNKDSKSIQDIELEKIVDYFIYADFSKGKELDLLIKKLCKIEE